MSYAASRPRYGAGVAASLSAELVFILLTMPVLALMGKDIWAVVRMPAALIAGPQVMEPPGMVPSDVLLGLAMHIGLGIVVGVLYAILLPRLGLAPITGGLVAGAVLYLLGFVILPAGFPEWLAPFRLPPLMHMVEIVTHAVYGAVFGLAYRKLTT
ncbi:MAG: hypothetical protein ACR2H9_00620 [Longimicrobiaceae bacterium]